MFRGFRHVQPTLFVLAFTLLVLTLLTPAARTNAATFDSSITPIVDLGCTAFSAEVHFTADRNNSGASGEIMEARVFDGKNNLIYVIDSDPLPLYSGWVLNRINEAYTSAPQANPLRLDLVSIAGNGFDEQPVYSTTGTCPGLATTGNAFTDGRINPQPYAPVVLYCAKTTLTAYSVTGTQTFSHTFDSSASVPANSIIESGGGADLYALADGRYAVIAPQSDGKRYMFVFDGCPNPGATEVYVSDPVTGQFVRSD